MLKKNIFFYLTKFPLNKNYFSSINTPEKALDYLEAIAKVLKLYAEARRISHGNTNLNPEIINLILSVTESIDLIHRQPNISLLNGGIDNFFQNKVGDYNFFKKNAALNPYLATGSSELDARLKGILKRSHDLPNKSLLNPNAQLNESYNLNRFNQYLTKPENNKLKEYLISLYNQKINNGERESVIFTKEELMILQNENYQAAIAYLHYFERAPGEFNAEANKLTLFKRARTSILNMTEALQSYDIKKFTSNTNIPAKWVFASADKKNLNENISIYQSGCLFTLNHENEISYFNKISNYIVQRSLREDIYVNNNKLTDREQFDENQNFTKIAQNDIDRLCQELKYLRNAPELQFLTAIDYFNDRLDLFTDKIIINKNDIQEYLRRVIFQPGVLNDELDKNPTCLETFNAFIGKAILYCQISAKTSENALYFYQLQAEVNGYALNKPNYSEGLKESIRKITFEQLNILERFDLSKISSNLDRYHLTKIKLQLILDLNKNSVLQMQDVQYMFDLLIDFSTAKREVKIESDEQRDAHKKITEASLQSLLEGKHEISMLALQWVKKNCPSQVDILNKIVGFISNYPYFYGLDCTGKKILGVNLTKGQILLGASYVSYPPDELSSTSFYQEILGKTLPKFSVSTCLELNREEQFQHVLFSQEPLTILDKNCSSRIYLKEKGGENVVAHFYDGLSWQSSTKSKAEFEVLKIDDFNQIIKCENLDELAHQKLAFSDNVIYILEVEWGNVTAHYNDGMSWKKSTKTQAEFEQLKTKNLKDVILFFGCVKKIKQISNHSSEVQKIVSLFGCYRYEPIKKYEILGAKTPAFFLNNESSNKPWIYQQEKEVNGIEKIYEKQTLASSGLFKRSAAKLCVLTNSESSEIYMNLPELFYQNRTTFWVSPENEAILIETPTSRYFIDEYRTALKELDEKNCETGFILCQENNIEIFALFINFECKEFTEILFKADAATQKISQLKINFPRYNLNLFGHFDVLKKVWVINPLDKPNLIFVGTQDGLVFEDSITKQRVLLTPNQSYYVNKETESRLNENDFKTIYHHPILDKENVCKREETGLGVSDLGVSQNSDAKNGFPAGTATYTNSEKYFSYIIDPKNNEYKAVSVEEHLYLAYLNLIKNKPVSALEAVRNLIKTGGLKGTIEELEIIDKIFNAAPNCADQINSPEYITVRSYVLYLVSDLFHQKKKFSIPDVLSLPQNTPDEFIKKRHYVKLKQFEVSLPELIFRHFKKNLNIRANIPKSMRLSRELEYKLMSRMNFKENNNLQMIARYRYLKNWYNSRELGNIESEKLAYPKFQAQHYNRKLELIQKGEKQKKADANLKQLGIINQSINLKTPILKSELYTQIELGEHSIDFDMLTPVTTEKEFFSHFIEIFNICRSTSRNLQEKRNQLKVFFNQTLQANALVPLEESRNKIYQLAPVLLTVLENAKKFNKIVLASKKTTEVNTRAPMTNSCDRIRFEEYFIAICIEAIEINETKYIRMVGYENITQPFNLELKASKLSKHTPYTDVHFR